jgi:hypothetical protein
LGATLLFEEVELEIVFDLAIFNGLEERGLLGILGEFTDLVIGKKSPAHLCKLALLLAPTCETLVVRVVKVEVIISIAPATKSSSRDIPHQLVNVLLIPVSLVGTVELCQ